MIPDPANLRAQIVGTGLIGGSIGLGLRRRGWRVSGSDLDPRRQARAWELGRDRRGRHRPRCAHHLRRHSGRGPSPRRPPRLSDGKESSPTWPGSRGPSSPSLTIPASSGATPWPGPNRRVSTDQTRRCSKGPPGSSRPAANTDPVAFATVRTAVTALGANVVELPAARHDDLVAMVSHVPHLTAATLMNLAADTALEHATLLRLAAGGFRDMTRIAAGDPAIWPDICVREPLRDPRGARPAAVCPRRGSRPGGGRRPDPDARRARAGPPRPGQPSCRGTVERDAPPRSGSRSSTGRASWPR